MHARMHRMSLQVERSGTEKHSAFRQVFQKDA